MPNKDGTGPKGQGPIDGHGKSKAMGKGKGNRGKKILFDTGGEGDILLANMKTVITNGPSQKSG